MTQGPARWENLVSGQLGPCWPQHSVAFATPRWVAPRWWGAGERLLLKLQEKDDRKPVRVGGFIFKMFLPKSYFECIIESTWQGQQ